MSAWLGFANGAWIAGLVSPATCTPATPSPRRCSPEPAPCLPGPLARGGTGRRPAERCGTAVRAAVSRSPSSGNARESAWAKGAPVVSRERVYGNCAGAAPGGGPRPLRDDAIRMAAG